MLRQGGAHVPAGRRNGGRLSGSIDEVAGVCTGQPGSDACARLSRLLFAPMSKSPAGAAPPPRCLPCRHAGLSPAPVSRGPGRAMLPHHMQLRVQADSHLPGVVGQTRGSDEMAAISARSPARPRPDGLRRCMCARQALDFGKYQASLSVYGPISKAQKRLDLGVPRTTLCSSAFPPGCCWLPGRRYGGTRCVAAGPAVRG